MYKEVNMTVISQWEILFLKELQWCSKRIFQSIRANQEAINSLLVFPFLFAWHMTSNIRENGPWHTLLPQRWGNFNNNNFTGQDNIPRVVKGWHCGSCSGLLLTKQVDLGVGQEAWRKSSHRSSTYFWHCNNTNLVEKSANLSFVWCNRFDRGHFHMSALIGSSWNNNSHHHHLTPRKQ